MHRGARNDRRPRAHSYSFRTRFASTVVQPYQPWALLSLSLAWPRISPMGTAGSEPRTENREPQGENEGETNSTRATSKGLRKRKCPEGWSMEAIGFANFLSMAFGLKRDRGKAVFSNHVITYPELNSTVIIKNCIDFSYEYLKLGCMLPG